MSNKTLARSAASLINRLFITSPTKQTSPLLSAQIFSNSSSSSSMRSILHNLQTHHSSPPPMAMEDAETLRRIASPEDISFPCGLPSSLRFFIDHGIDDDLSKGPLLTLPKRTYQPSHIKRKRTHGYLARALAWKTFSMFKLVNARAHTEGANYVLRMINFCYKATKGGRKVIARRIAKGRARIAI